MNAVEIEEAISALAEQPFDRDEFPFTFLQAFGNKPTTIKRLRSGSSNKSDQGGVLQTNNVHLKVCAEGEVTKTLAQLKVSPATTKAKAKFVLATDGTDLEAEDLTTGETIACAYGDFPDHFGFFLPLAGISTVKQIRESAFDRPCCINHRTSAEYCQSRRKKGPFAGVKVGQLRCRALLGVLPIDVVARTQVVLVIGCSTSDLDT